MSRYSIWYQLWASSVIVNPIFAVNVIKISQDKTLASASPSKSHFGWETTHDDSLWANGRKVWLFEGPFGEINCSWNLLFPWAQPHQLFEKILQSVYTRLWVLTRLALGEQLAARKQTHPPWISDSLHCGTRHRRHDVPIKNCALMGCLRGRVLRDFRSRSCFCLNSYRSCDTCLIVKTLPFAECTISDYTFLSQACSEQGKAHTFIAFVPRYFFAGTRSSRKWWPVRRQVGLGNIFRPWRGHIYYHIYYRKATKIDKDERNFHCWAPNGAPKGMLREKMVLQEILLCVDCQRYSKQFHEGIRTIRIRFEVCFRRKGPSKYLETWELKWNGKTTCKVALKEHFVKSRPLGKKESRRDKLGKFASKALAVWLYLPQLRGSLFSFDQRSKSQHNCCHNGNTQFPLNIQRVTPFSLGTMAVTLSASSERHLSYPTEQYLEQYSNTDSWIDRWRTSFFPWGAALALVPNCGVTWFSHIPQPWPATLDVKLSTLSLG